MVNMQYVTNAVVVGSYGGLVMTNFNEKNDKMFDYITTCTVSGLIMVKICSR